MLRMFKLFGQFTGTDRENTYVASRKKSIIDNQDNLIAGVMNELSTYREQST